jgi:transposase-like protein
VRIGRTPMNLNRAGIVRDRRSGMTLTAVANKWGISRSLVCKLVKRAGASAGDEAPVPPPPQVVDFAHSASTQTRW